MKRINNVGCLISYLVLILELVNATSLAAMFMYCIHTSFKDPHVFFAVFGYNFFILQSVLVTFSMSGAGHAQCRVHEIMAHMILQAIGVVFIIAAVVFACRLPGKKSSIHFVLGMTTFGLMILSVFTGIYEVYSRKHSIFWKGLHIFIGAATFLMACAHYIVSLQMKFFKSFLLPPYCSIVLACLIAVMALFVIVLGLCLMKRHYERIGCRHACY